MPRLFARAASRVLPTERFDVTGWTGDALHKLHGVIAQAAADEDTPTEESE